MAAKHVTLAKSPMRIYDVSVPISARTPTYPGDPGVNIRPWLALADGDAANVSAICFGAHTGTHVDAPAHFIKDAPKLQSMDLYTLIGAVQVMELPHSVLAIAESDLEHGVDAGTTRILFKTRNSEFWDEAEVQFHSDYTYISPAAAKKLIDLGIRLVGIDYLSVERFESADFETHQILLANGVVIVEGLDLRQVPAGAYELICLPLKIAEGSGDGAPARVVLRSVDE